MAFYFKIDPDELDDEKWSMAWARLEFSLEWMAKNKMNSFGI